MVHGYPDAHSLLWHVNWHTVVRSNRFSLSQKGLWTFFSCDIVNLDLNFNLQIFDKRIEIKWFCILKKFNEINSEQKKKIEKAKKKNFLKN